MPTYDRNNNYNLPSLYSTTKYRYYSLSGKSSFDCVMGKHCQLQTKETFHVYVLSCPEVLSLFIFIWLRSKVDAQQTLRRIFFIGMRRFPYIYCTFETFQVQKIFLIINGLILNIFEPHTIKIINGGSLVSTHDFILRNCLHPARPRSFDLTCAS